MTTEESASASPIPSPTRPLRRLEVIGHSKRATLRALARAPFENAASYDRAVPFWAWIPLVVLLVLAVLLGVFVLLGRIRNGRYLRPVITFLSKVPLFKRWFQKASIAALERENPELAGAMKKMQAFGEPKSPEQAQRMLNLLTPSERRAYMEAVGQEQQLPEATNRQLRRRMEHGGAGMPVRTKPVRTARRGRSQDRQEREEEALARIGPGREGRLREGRADSRVRPTSARTSSSVVR